MRQANNILESGSQAQEIVWPDTQFHDTIHRAAGNLYIINIINNLRNIVGRMRYLGLSADSTWSQVWEEHAQLIHFLERRDKEGAISLIKTHLVNAASYVTSAPEAEMKH